MNENEKYNHIRNNLKKLSKIRTRPDFNQRLFSKIHALENEKHSYPFHGKIKFEKPSEWLSRFFKPALIPVASLSVILILAFIYFLNIYQTKQQDTTEQLKAPVVQEDKKTMEKDPFDETKPVITPEITKSNEITSSKTEEYIPHSDYEETPLTKDVPKTEDIIEQKLEGAIDEREEIEDKTGNYKIAPEEIKKERNEKDDDKEKKLDKSEKKSKHSDLKSSKIDSTKKDSTKTDSLIHQNIKIEEEIDDTIKQEAPSEIKE